MALTELERSIIDTIDASPEKQLTLSGLLDALGLPFSHQAARIAIWDLVVGLRRIDLTENYDLRLAARTDDTEKVAV